MSDRRQVHASPELLKTNIEHMTSQQGADYMMANTLARTFLRHGKVDKY